MPARRREGASRPRATLDQSGCEILRQLAEEDAAAVLAAARSAAGERARAILEEALVEELLSAVGRSAQGTGDDSGWAWWAYCVVRATQADELAAGLSGVEPGTPVEAVAEGELAVLVSRVPLAEYGDDRLREHLEDLAWLERTARAHEAVQQAVLALQALVPLRLCTLFRESDRIRRALRENAEVFSRNLAGLDGVKEWGMKVFFYPGAVSGAVELVGTEAAEDSGTAYLAGRQQERDRVAQAHAMSQRCIEDVRQAVRGLAIDERINPAQRPEAHGRDAEMILNGAYLVTDVHVDELKDTVSELQARWADHGLIVELTGPWPPYNFVSEAAGMFS